jgi:hypothetical protein
MRSSTWLSGAAWALFLAASCSADTVVFKNGHELDGKVLEQDATSILLELEYGTLRIEKDKILRIEPDSPDKLAGRDTANKPSAATTAAAPTKAAPKPQPQTAQAPKNKNQKAGKAAATAAAQTAQGQQGQGTWSDQYLEWRRTHRNPSTNGNSTTATDPRDFLGRVGTTNTGRSRSGSGTGNQYGNPQSLIDQYMGGYRTR